MRLATYICITVCPENLEFKMWTHFLISTIENNNLFPTQLFSLHSFYTWAVSQDCDDNVMLSKEYKKYRNQVATNMTQSTNFEKLIFDQLLSTPPLLSCEAVQAIWYSGKGYFQPLHTSLHFKDFILNFSNNGIYLQVQVQVASSKWLFSITFN